MIGELSFDRIARGTAMHIPYKLTSALLQATTQIKWAKESWQNKSRDSNVRKAQVSRHLSHALAVLSTVISFLDENGFSEKMSANPQINQLKTDLILKAQEFESEMENSLRYIGHESKVFPRLVDTDNNALSFDDKNYLIAMDDLEKKMDQLREDMNHINSIWHEDIISQQDDLEK